MLSLSPRTHLTCPIWLSSSHQTPSLWTTSSLLTSSERTISTTPWWRYQMKQHMNQFRISSTIMKQSLKSILSHLLHKQKQCIPTLTWMSLWSMKLLDSKTWSSSLKSWTTCWQVMKWTRKRTNGKPYPQPWKWFLRTSLRSLLFGPRKESKKLPTNWTNPESESTSGFTTDRKRRKKPTPPPPLPPIEMLIRRKWLTRVKKDKSKSTQLRMSQKE